MTSYSRIILQLTVVLIVLSAGGLLYSQWPSLLHVSAKLQKELNVEMAVLIQKVVSDPLKAGGLLTLFSFLYGLLHALGPGHGKVILSAYIATHPAKLRHSALLSILASLLQGTVAVILVSVVLFILNLSVRQLNNVSQITEKASYAFIILFGAIIVIRTLRRLFIRPPVNKPQIKTIRVSDNKPPCCVKTGLSAKRTSSDMQLWSSACYAGKYSHRQLADTSRYDSGHGQPTVFGGHY
ncbi:hypothetical protein P4W15_16315 [Morganella morganii]|nr:hypothetical protein [Morganella morganii]